MLGVTPSRFINLLFVAKLFTQIDDAITGTALTQLRSLVKYSSWTIIQTFFFLKLLIFFELLITKTGE